MYIETSKLIEDVVYDLIKDDKKIKEIKAAFKPRMSKEDYLKLLTIK